MFANTFQSGFLSIFYSLGSNPLALWDKQVKNGHIRRLVDDEVKSFVLEISGTNVATTYITCPVKPMASLGVRLPFLVLIIKNMKRYFTFEIQVLDDKDMHRRFRVSNFQSTTKVNPFCTMMPIGLSGGWNQIQFNLADFTRRAYGTTYRETVRVQIHANIRIRRIYFTDRLYEDEELPNEFKLFLPRASKEKRPSKEERKPSGAKDTPAPLTSAQSQKTEEEEKAIQMEEQEIPSGAPPTPVTSATVVTEEKPPEEEGGEAPATEESRPAEEGAPGEAEGEDAEGAPAEGADGAPPEGAGAAPGGEEAPEGGEASGAETAPPTETTDAESPPESPAADTAAEESPTEAAEVAED